MDINTVNQLLTQGGILMYPLLVLLFMAILIILIKLFHLQKGRILPPKIVEKIEKLLLDNKIPEATAFCKKYPTPMTNIILAGILHYQRNEVELKTLLEDVGRQELPVIRRYLTTLGTIANVSPLLGLLGTVFGMISVFATLAEKNDVNPSMLAGGISEALLTTALGLIIAMLSMAFYNHFMARINNLMIEMEKTSLHIVAILKRL